MNHQIDIDFMARAASEEPLHPDLQAHLDTDGPLGPMIRHPLVYDMLPRPGLANDRYAYKVEALARAIEEQDWHSVVFLHERPYRAWALSKHAEDITDDQTYWELVGSAWVDSENIWQNSEEWHDLLHSVRGGREAMMNEEEQEKLAALPETLTIWRGCQLEVNEDGLSWSLSRPKAEWFAKRFAGEEDEGSAYVIEGRVSREHVIAHFLGRGEDEIVALEEDVEIVQYWEVE